MFFLDLFFGGIVSCFLAETRWAPMLGVSENSDGIPEHDRKYSRHVQLQQWRKRRQRISQRLIKPQKLWILYTWLASTFIGRRRDFYIPKTSSNSKNIPSVNMYMNVFYNSYIYKPATSSHTKPGLFETTSLTLLLTDSWISPTRKSSYVTTSELELWQIPELRRSPNSWVRRFTTPGLHRFATSGLHRSKIPNLHEFMTPSFAGPRFQALAGSRLRSFAGSRFPIFASSRLWSFAGSRFPIFASSRFWSFAGSRFPIFASSISLKTHFTNFTNLDVSRVAGFPEFPNNWPCLDGWKYLTFQCFAHCSTFRLFVENIILPWPN
jgi:hypothetical protein